MPPAYVKPYVERQKNDMADAEAICEAVTRANMRFVPTKTPEQQSCPRNFSAWIGLVPKQHSSGGKERLGSISKQGDRYLRSLFVAGALAVIR